ncbi:hypothetical protein T01_864 [Trichinella spiralis]|uniref:Uncharacterized protein n=1 Tax=Trichinella spiralis TaxID=6334 RepID=A0A0V1BXB7_TRISP|nr:hypothetical protein T01_864 [Trichinella spiralis]
MSILSYVSTSEQDLGIWRQWFQFIDKRRTKADIKECNVYCPAPLEVNKKSPFHFQITMICTICFLSMEK